MIRFLAILAVIVVARLFLFYFATPGEQIIRGEVSKPSIFKSIKEHVKEKVFFRNLAPDQAGLLSGIVFGDNDFSEDTNEVFKKTGLLHVVAASGMNVSMLTSFLLATAVIFFSRKNAIILTALAITFYTALADFQPSIVRASIMAVIALSAGLTGRQNTSILALIITATIMIFFDPEILTSISFILSFSATLGIILLDPILKAVLKKPFFGDFRTTLSAQIATTPIILFFFGTYSFASLPANFLILWTVPPLMALGFIASVVSFISPFIAIPVVALAMPLLIYFLAVAEFVSKFELNFETADLPWGIILGYYFVLLSFIVLIYKRSLTVRTDFKKDEHALSVVRSSK